MSETRNAKTKPGTAKPRLDEAYGDAAKVHARASSRDRRVAGYKTLSSVQNHFEDVDDDSELTEMLERIGQLHLDACVVCGIHGATQRPDIGDVEASTSSDTRPCSADWIAPRLAQP